MEEIGRRRNRRRGTLIPEKQKRNPGLMLPVCGSGFIRLHINFTETEKMTH